MRLASQGRGIRTLYALKCLAAKHAQQDGEASARMPSFFSDAAWNILSNHRLSTSNCGTPALRMFGFGPVSAEGFGVGYIIKDDNMQFCVSSFNRQTARFISSLQVLSQPLILRLSAFLSFPNPSTWLYSARRVGGRQRGRKGGRVGGVGAHRQIDI